MIIDTVLTPQRVLCDVRGGSKKKVLEVIAENICEHVPAINNKDLFNNLISREKLGTTGLGKGIALPHCRSKACQQPVGMLVRLAEAIDYDSVDKEAVDILFALVVPEESTQEHLTILQALAARFQSDSLLSRLRGASSSEQLFEIISEPV